MRCLVIAAVLLALVVGMAHADFNYGSFARSVAMGGSGLAVVDDPIEAGAINPAAYAVKSPKFRLMLPGIDYRFEGTSLSELKDISDDIRNASGDSAIELATRLGKQDTMIEMSGNTGFSIGAIVVTVDGQANVALAPSTQFKAWAANPAGVDWSAYVDAEGNVDLPAIQSDYYADVTGQLIAALPAVGMGFKVPNHDEWNIGVRVKSLRSRVTRQRVTVESASVTGGTPSDPEISLNLEASDILGTPEVVRDTGLGADIGIIYQTPNPKLQLTTALVLSNILKPNMEGVRIDSMVSAGAALRVSNKLLLTGDLVNINRAYNKDTEMRLGAELKPIKWLALRAGYGDGNLTYGIGIKGINLAFSKDNPLVVGRLWNF